MNCERIRERIPEALAGRLDPAAREKLVEHLEICAGCRTEVAELNAVWRAMESLNNTSKAAPDPVAKARFMDVLEAYRAGLGVGPTHGGKSRFGILTAHPVWQMAMAAALLMGGIFFGRFQTQPRTEVATQVASLKGQIESLRQLVALSMLQQPSPSARLRGVSYSEQMAQGDSQVQQALLFAVTHDANVNVRLSAVDALQRYAGDASVVRAMVDAIPVQESPLVQIALIDQLTQMRARSSLADLARLAKDQQIEEVVRQRAAWAVEKLGGEK